jgi:hypothetical protein
LTTPTPSTIPVNIKYLPQALETHRQIGKII